MLFRGLARWDADANHVVALDQRQQLLLAPPTQGRGWTARGRLSRPWSAEHQDNPCVPMAMEPAHPSVPSGRAGSTM